MASSTQLRANTNQHQPKNIKSKKDDCNLKEAMHQCISYLENRFQNLIKDNYYFEFKKEIQFSEIIEVIKTSEVRKNFSTQYDNHWIKPDGGIIWLKKKADINYKKPVLISEIKRQGTNDQRKKEGKKRQAQGNAIERLGKNLTGIKTMFNHLNITPFVCFGWGCDFKEGSSILARVFMLNEFYDLNKTHVMKKDGNADTNDYSPVSMYFRVQQWTTKEMFDILKEVAETSVRIYLT